MCWFTITFNLCVLKSVLHSRMMCLDKDRKKPSHARSYGNSRDSVKNIIRKLCWEENLKHVKSGRQGGLAISLIEKNQTFTEVSSIQKGGLRTTGPSYSTSSSYPLLPKFFFLEIVKRWCGNVSMFFPL